MPFQFLVFELYENICSAGKMFNGRQKDKLLYYIKVSKYINDFKLQVFLWEYYCVEA